MSHVPHSWAVRAAVAGLRGRVLSGCGPSYTCIQSVRPRVLRKNSGILVSNPSSSRNAHLPRRLSFLCPAAQRRAGIHQTDLPGACRLNGLSMTFYPSNPIWQTLVRHFFVFPRIRFYKDYIFLCTRTVFFPHFLVCKWPLYCFFKYREKLKYIFSNKMIIKAKK